MPVLVASLLAAGAVLAVVRRRWFLVRVAGQSMSPTYADGDRLVFRRVAPRSYGVSDCVAFVPPGPIRPGQPPLLVKRVAAVAGDPLPAAFRAASGSADASVPAGHVVVFGDNPDSFDSRHFGYLSTARVVGAAVRRRSLGS